LIHTPADFLPGVVPSASAQGDPIICVLQGEHILLQEEAPRLASATLAKSILPSPPEQHYLGQLADRPCWLLIAPKEFAAPPSHLFGSMRSLFAAGDAAELAIITRALQIAEWSRSHRYCGVCGTATEDLPGERARHCPACEYTAYPRLSPAMMVLVRRGREILLARATRFKLPMWSALAGFVEPGESLEDTVHREVREEVGIEVGELQYFGSQSWPFPHSLMIAFTARYAGGELRPDLNEIAEAGWFLPESLPPLPSPASIASHLILSVAATAR
jgi:NAD+ diphosphatase